MRMQQIWRFLQEDTWQSYIVSILLIIIGIKFVFFPLLAFVTQTPLPLVVVESCSMYHNDDVDEWWNANEVWYTTHGISKEQFNSFPFRNGINKGDIIIVWGRGTYEKGDVIIFNAAIKYPIIHRIVTISPLSTKGDNGRTNPEQLDREKEIQEEAIMGKAVGRIPFLGWVKLIFFEPGKSPSDRGLCK